VPINLSEIREFVSAIAQTNITELTLKSEDFELTVRKEGSLTITTPVLPQKEATPVSPPVSPTFEVVSPEEPPTPTPPERKFVPITSPMVGTFYRASGPDDPPFVDVNENIRTGQVVCIIEAMKLMNEIESEIAGQVMEILVTNGEPVEYGQTLMWVNPD
jgi:acetyl-CoA carboxylase biotin carboxyl carrier protein